MTEAELQESVRRMCADLGLYHYHPHDSRKSEGGWPDSVILNLRTGRLALRELKTQSGTLSSDRRLPSGIVIPGQKTIGYALTAGGHDWQVWRPSDLLDGTIAAQLCQLAGLKARA
jgi:hypothetical protein